MTELFMHEKLCFRLWAMFYGIIISMGKLRKHRKKGTERNVPLSDCPPDNINWLLTPAVPIVMITVRY
jgi:hypothetical protein